MSDMRDTDARLVELAGRLKLTYIKTHLSELMESATKGGMTPRETLDFVFNLETTQRNANRIRLAEMSAHFPFMVSMADFDMDFQPTLDRGLIRELCRMEWVPAGENVVFIGPSGVGKTHLSIALGRLALQKGHTVRFYTAQKLVELLEKALRSDTLETVIKEVNRVKLLIIDEVGYLPFKPVQGQLLLQLISLRYEKKSIVITSNRTPGEWGYVFGDSVAATAALDRLLHHCTPVLIKGNSYRTRKYRQVAAHAYAETSTTASAEVAEQVQAQA